MKKSAFTLIELLVVISIIAVLASISIPVIGGVQENARAVQDANNLRQLGIASIAYFSDHDDTIFCTGSSFALQLNPTNGTSYIGTWKPFQSPFDKRVPSDLAATAPISYDLNRNLVNPKALNVSDIVSPSSCIMLAPLLSNGVPNVAFAGKTTTTPQLGMSSNSSPTALTGGTHSKGKRLNVLFQDAHVEPMMMVDFHKPLQNNNSSTRTRVSDLRWNAVAQ